MAEDSKKVTERKRAARRMQRRAQRNNVLKEAWRGKARICRPDCPWVGTVEMNALDDLGRPICEGSWRGKVCKHERLLYDTAFEKLSQVYSESTAGLAASIEVEVCRKAAAGQDGLQDRIELLKIVTSGELRLRAMLLQHEQKERSLAMAERKLELKEANRPRGRGAILKEIAASAAEAKDGDGQGGGDGHHPLSRGAKPSEEQTDERAP